MSADEIMASYPVLTDKLDKTFDAIRQRCYRGMVEDRERYGWCRIRWADTMTRTAQAIGVYTSPDYPYVRKG